MQKTVTAAAAAAAAPTAPRNSSAKWGDTQLKAFVEQWKADGSEAAASGDVEAMLATNEKLRSIVTEYNQILAKTIATLKSVAATLDALKENPGRPLSRQAIDKIKSSTTASSATIEQSTKVLSDLSALNSFGIPHHSPQTGGGRRRRR